MQILQSKQHFKDIPCFYAPVTVCPMFQALVLLSKQLHFTIFTLEIPSVFLCTFKAETGTQNFTGPMI